MNPVVPLVAKFLAILTVLTDIGILAYFGSFVVSLLSKPIKKLREATLQNIAPYARILAFMVPLTAMGGSLFYSDVAKYTPCILCWWQRIFMYPQTVLIGMGILKNDTLIADYSTGLSAVGGAIALYHYYIQLGGASFFSCEQIGYSASCSQRFTMEFGYVTIPMMALTAFIAIILLMRISKRVK